MIDAENKFLLVLQVALVLVDGSDKFGVFESIKSTVFTTLFNKIWNFVVFSFGILVLGGFVVW